MSREIGFWVIALSLSLVFVGYVQADWPQYRGPNGDGRIDESLPQGSWSEEGPQFVWNIGTPLGFSSFSVADGMAVTLISRDEEGDARHEVCLMLDALTGKPLWERTFGSSKYEHGGGDAGAPGNRGGDGPRSTPTIHEGRIYVYDAHLLLTCMEATSGKILWQQDIAKDFEGKNITWKNAASPVIVGDMVCVPGGGPGKAFLAFDHRSGELVWHSGNEAMTHATPVVTPISGTNQLVFFAQSGLVGVDPRDGEELWHAPFDYRTSTAASPVVERDFVYCSAGYGVGAGVFQISRSDQGFSADEVWLMNNKLMNHWSTPVVRDGFLYGIYGFKEYGDAPLQCVELETGKVQWSQEGFGQGNCILVGEHLIVLSDDGRLVIVEAQPNAYVELTNVQAVSGKCWSTPAYNDGLVYVRSTVEGACLRLGELPIGDAQR